MPSNLRVITDKRQIHCFKSLFLPPLLLFIFLFPMTGIRTVLAQPASGKKFTVTVDAGHGGKDTGAPGKKSVEKNIALAIALKLGHYIESQMEDVNVYYTRKTDVFIPLYERAQIANRNKSDLFISIHVNANKKSSPTGTSTYVMGFSRSAENLDLVMQENKAILLEQDYQTKYAGFDPTSPESYIIFNNVQNNNLTQSLEIAAAVQDKLRSFSQRKDIGVHQGNLVVLWGCAKPSILVETGFISNPQEEEFLMTDDGQDLIANGIFKAFKDYKESIDSRFADVAQAGNPKPDAEKKAIEVEKKPEEIAKGTMETVKNSDKVEKVKGETEKKSDEDLLRATKPEKTRVENETGSEVEFRIQVIASIKKLPKDAREFKGIKGLKEIQLDGYYKYMSEAVKTYGEALELRRQMAVTFSGAFIVAFKNGEKVPLNSVTNQSKK